jgi:hypothetical protein
MKMAERRNARPVGRLIIVANDFAFLRVLCGSSLRTLRLRSLRRRQKALNRKEREERGAKISDWMVSFGDRLAAIDL